MSKWRPRMQHPYKIPLLCAESKSNSGFETVLLRTVLVSRTMFLIVEGLFDFTLLSGLFIGVQQSIVNEEFLSPYMFEKDSLYNAEIARVELSATRRCAATRCEL